MAAAPDPAPDAEFPEDAIEVARIIDAWGIKGWFRVQPHAKDPQALFSSKRWFLRPPEPRAGPAPRAEPRPLPVLPTLLRITVAREHGAALYVDEAHAAGVLGEAGRGSVARR